MQRDDEFATWKAQSSKWRGQLDVPPEFAPWTKTFSKKNCGKMQKRALDLIDCTAMQVWKRAKVPLGAASDSRRDALKDTLLDMSQSHERRPFSNGEDIARCLTTGSWLYSYRLDRVLLPLEHLLLQGYPVSTRIPEKMNDKDVRDLAGEAIALPCLAVVVWALYIHKSFP